MSIDLHSHSYYSDGFLSPTQLIQIAKKQGCNTLALTDHDTIDGLNEAKEKANQLGITLIPGVEISATWNNTNIHIIGLNIDTNNTVLKKGLKQHQEYRKLRSEKIARGLSGARIADAMQKTQALSHGMITRMHFAQMLIQEGICKNIKSVFRRFLSNKKPGSVNTQWTQYDKVINWIHDAGGMAVLAHPLRYKMTHTKIKRILDDLITSGCDGIETVTDNNNADEITLINGWARKLGILESVGSDYHGWPNQTTRIGNLSQLPNVNNAIWKDASWNNY